MSLFGNTESIKRPCDSCKEPVSIDAAKCPHCRSKQLTTRGKIIVTTIIGLLLLPVTYVAVPIAWGYGIPSGAEGFGVGLVWGIAILGPLFLLIAFGAYIQRREAIQEAADQA